MNLMIVATAIGMPLDLVVMVGGFYRFFDMGTTSMNCLATFLLRYLLTGWKRDTKRPWQPKWLEKKLN